MSNLANAVVSLLEDLERISHEHEEVTDTDVRESIHLALTWYFVWAQERTRFPRSFGMFTAEGDRLVAGAVLAFLEASEKSGELARTPVGQARLDVLQGDATTADEKVYDEFIGHRDTPLPMEPLPELMFSVGDYEELGGANA